MRRSLYFDRMAVCDAYYLWAKHHHNGQWCPRYEVLGRLADLGYSPGLTIREDRFDNFFSAPEYEHAAEIYRSLVSDPPF